MIDRKIGDKMITFEITIGEGATLFTLFILTHKLHRLTVPQRWGKYANKQKKNTINSYCTVCLARR